MMGQPEHSLAAKYRVRDHLALIPPVGRIGSLRGDACGAKVARVHLYMPSHGIEWIYWYIPKSAYDLLYGGRCIEAQSIR